MSRVSEIMRELRCGYAEAKRIAEQEAPCSAAEVDSACNVADFIRNYVRDRQTAIRKHCDAIHDTAPIQGQEWKLALEELDHVAEACISVSRRTMKQPNDQGER